MRSWLIIEAGDAAKLREAPAAGADAIVVDLTDLPVGDDAEDARQDVCEWLRTYADPMLATKPFARWVKIKPVDTPLWREDLVAVMAAAPDGVVLPRIQGPDAIRMLASELYEIEQKLGLKQNSTKIVPQIGETPMAALNLAQLTSDRQPRLTGFTWNGASLARAIGAKRTHDITDNWTGVLQHVRSMTILLAKAMGVTALETASSHESDYDTVFNDAQSAKHDGFTGMFATCPDQISAIEDAYAITSTERAEADAVLDQFAALKEAMQNELLPRAGGDETETMPDEPAQPAAVRPHQMRIII